MKLFLFFSIIGLMAQLDVWAQGSSNFHIWTDFNPSFNLSEQWKIVGDLGYRVEPAENFHVAYVRPGIIYEPNKIINFAAGIANFNSWESGEFIKREIRTFQLIVVAWPKIAGFQFKHRLGLEQRWFYLAELNLNEYVSRSRYYLEIKSPQFNLFNIKAPFFITANLEILRDLNDNEVGRLVDHNRYTLGIGNHITDRFRAEVRYKLINTVDPLTNSFIREINVLRIRLYYRFTST
jgi:hypothetical protein